MAGEAYKAWLQELSTEGNANSDLVAHFFRRCFGLLRVGGSFGLIATNTIAQGDTRRTGLRWICTHCGTIVAARKRYRWPGVAAVVVSIVHVLKGGYSGELRLDGRRVEQITAFLFDKGGHEDPKPLKANAGKSFVGNYLLGMGFTFDDSGPTDDDSPGIASPISTMERLIRENPKNAEVIFPFIGGEEVNSSPHHLHHRYVINFGERSKVECRNRWPELMAIVEKKVKPDRLTKSKDVANYPWWLHWRSRPELHAAIVGCERVLVTSAAAVSHHMINSVTAGHVFSHKLIVFPESTSFRHMVMQSLFHEEWSRAFGATQGSADALTYNPTDVFLTFPFPEQGNALSDICQSYTKQRAFALEQMNLGPTKAYGALHSPLASRDEIQAFRTLHDQANHAVAKCFGWLDIDLTCGFGIDKLDLDDDITLPAELQERIDSGSLFFTSVHEAASFDSQLRGATHSKSKLSWRYRWPDAVRDEVLARLLALNSERYEEEQALGEQLGRAPRRSSRSKPTTNTSTAAFPMPREVQVDLFQPNVEQLELGR